uniref:Transcription initiation protein spt3 n=1 Tax=Syphacia muris TaxID=451379 RepID=A0A0N5AL98_9BILA
MLDEDDAEIILNTFGKMMYAYGDEADPLLKCKVFVAAVVEEQVKKMLEQAKITATERKCDRIDIVDIVFLFRRHLKQLNRMFQYLQSADLARGYTRYNCFSSANDISTIAKPAVEDPEDDVILSDFGKDAQKMYVAISHWDATGEVRRFLKECPKDNVKIDRIRKMTKRTSEMDSNGYMKFSEARLYSMVSQSGKRSEREAQRFIRWMGNPKISTESLLLLSYIVSEMTCVIVEGAIIARRDEDSTHFLNETPVNCLQMRHYEQSLRKNRGYMERGSILLGYF